MHAGRPFQPRHEVVGVVGADAGPRPVLAPGIAPGIAVAPEAARHRHERGRLGIEDQRILGPVADVVLSLVPGVLARAQLPARGPERDMRIRSVGSDDPVPARQERALPARMVISVTDADAVARISLRTRIGSVVGGRQVAGPLVEVQCCHQFGVAHESILPGTTDIDRYIGSGRDCWSRPRPEALARRRSETMAYQVHQRGYGMILLGDPSPSVDMAGSSAWRAMNCPRS